MTLLWVDAAGLGEGDFEHLYSGPGFSESTVRGLKAWNTSSPQVRILSSTEEDDGIIAGVRVHHITGPDVARCLVFQGDGGLVQHIVIDVNVHTGALRARFGSPSSSLSAINDAVLATTEPNLVFPDHWYYVEAKVKIADGSGGSVVVRYNEATVINVSGIDTRNGGTDALVDAVGPGGSQGAAGASFTDLYIANEQGSDVSDFVGDHRGRILAPNAVGNYNEQTGSDGDQTDSHLLVDELGEPVDTDYVGSTTVGHRQTFGHQNLSPVTGSILGINQHYRGLKSDAGAKSFRSIIRRGGVDSTGPDVALGITPVTFARIIRNDPASGVPFTIANVNDLETGTEVRA